MHREKRRVTNWLLVTTFLLPLLVLFVGFAASADEGHDYDAANDPYIEWKREDGSSSCCSSNDCRPAKVALVEDQYHIEVGGTWCPVVARKIFNYRLGKGLDDGGAHVCASPVGPYTSPCEGILCIRMPDIN